MNAITYNIISLVLIVVIVWGIHLMSSPKTAVKGINYSAIGMALAIIVTLFHYSILDLPTLWIAMAIGSLIGAYFSFKVKMIQMPQSVAMLNGFGGGASALVAFVTMNNGDVLTLFSQSTGALALVVGGVTFSGSMMAAGKLARLINQRPVILKNHSLYNWLTILAMAVLVVVTSMATEFSTIMLLSIITLLAALFYGVLFTMRVGGADMPITISLLNSLSGVAGAITGFVIYDPLLVAIGGVVGASGLVLTQIMCRAMNRHLLDILTGKTSAPQGKKAATPKNKAAVSNSGSKNQPASAPEVVKEIIEEKHEKNVLADAKKVVIVPGYGMALAQAQFEVKTLADKLEKQGKDVKFAIHPVAGRMPGHMNVLLAEVDVPYDQLYEMDAINPEFATTDVVIIVGANDVVNPAANSAEGTPIYGMPILDVDQAKHVIVCNYDTKPGYAGVDNPLYSNKSNVTLLLGDAKETVGQLTAALDGKATQKSESQPAATQDQFQALRDAQKVIIVPGYGMALAQAQFEVKKLADKLEKQGKDVKFAIHPVAGRMPGHMNVLLAEVDVPYDQLYEMDAINPEFASTDVVIIVGANDVVNPAANSAEGTPIYGMPILDVDHAKHVIVCNYDTKPGYAGVDNPIQQ